MAKKVVAVAAKPLLSPGAILFLEAIVRPHFGVFEWGAGGSTLWFAQRCRSVVSVEHQDTWYEYLAERLAAEELEAELELVALEDYASYIEPFGEFDLVMVDGLDRLREDCVRAALDHVRRGGWLVLDDTNWAKLRRAVGLVNDRGWRATHVRAKKIVKGTKRWTRTTFWRRPTVG